MLQWLHHGCSEFSELPDVIDCIGKYLEVEKMAFCQFLIFAIMKYKFSGTIFFQSVPMESFMPVTKDVVDRNLPIITFSSPWRKM